MSFEVSVANENAFDERSESNNGYCHWFKMIQNESYGYTMPL